MYFLTKQRNTLPCLTTFLMDIKDFRRAQAQKYKLHDVLLFSILALLCNAKSYRDIHRFMLVHFTELKNDFSLLWNMPPAYTTIRNIIKGTDSLRTGSCLQSLHPVPGQLLCKATRADTNSHLNSPFCTMVSSVFNSCIILKAVSADVKDKPG